MRSVTMMAGVLVAGVAWGKPAADPLAKLSVPKPMVGTTVYGAYATAKQIKLGELTYEVTVKGKTVTTTATLQAAFLGEAKATCTFDAGFVVRTCTMVDWAGATGTEVISAKGDSYQLQTLDASGGSETTEFVTAGDPLRGVSFDLALVAAVARAGVDPTYLTVYTPDLHMPQPFGHTTTTATDAGVHLELYNRSYDVSKAGLVTSFVITPSGEPLHFVRCDGACPDRLGDAVDDTPAEIRDAVRAIIGLGAGLVGGEAIAPFLDPDQLYAAMASELPAGEPRPSNDALMAAVVAGFPRPTAKPTPEMQQMVDAAVALMDVTIEGDTASVSLPGQGAVLHLVRIDGHWKVDFTSLMQMGAAE